MNKHLPGERFGGPDEVNLIMGNLFLTAIPKRTTQFPIELSQTFSGRPGLNVNFCTSENVQFASKGESTIKKEPVACPAAEAEGAGVAKEHFHTLPIGINTNR